MKKLLAYILALAMVAAAAWAVAEENTESTTVPETQSVQQSHAAFAGKTPHGMRERPQVQKRNADSKRTTEDDKTLQEDSIDANAEADPEENTGKNTKTTKTMKRRPQSTRGDAPEENKEENTTTTRKAKPGTTSGAAPEGNAKSTTTTRKAKSGTTSEDAPEEKTGKSTRKQANEKTADTVSQPTKKAGNKAQENDGAAENEANTTAENQSTSPVSLKNFEDMVKSGKISQESFERIRTYMNTAASEGKEYTEAGDLLSALLEEGAILQSEYDAVLATK